MDVSVDLIHGYVSVDLINGYVSVDLINGYVSVDLIHGYVSVDLINAYVSVDLINGYVSVDLIDGYVSVDLINGYVSVDLINVLSCLLNAKSRASITEDLAEKYNAVVGRYLNQFVVETDHSMSQDDGQTPGTDQHSTLVSYFIHSIIGQLIMYGVRLEDLCVGISVFLCVCRYVFVTSCFIVCIIVT